jgi:Protein of unknown function (DUF732)
VKHNDWKGVRTAAVIVPVQRVGGFTSHVRSTCELSVPVSNSTMAVDPFRPIFVAAAAGLLSAALAHADTRDDQFLGLLSNDGLNAGPPDQIVALAHQRCDANGLSRQGWYNFRFGGQPSQFNVAISNLSVKLQSHGLTTDQAVQFMRDAVAVYCPDTGG